MVQTTDRSKPLGEREGNNRIGWKTAIWYVDDRFAKH
jgi:hypothetical protein